MKAKWIIVFLITVFLTSCENNTDCNFEIGQGFEIYLTEKPYAHNLYLDYSIVDFDTILLSDMPILRYSDLKRYNSHIHKLTLGISHDSLNIGDAGVYGRMFVVTVDKVPIYCGFKWPVISSVPCNWVFIEEPFKELDNLKGNEIVISFNSEIYPVSIFYLKKKLIIMSKKITDNIKVNTLTLNDKGEKYILCLFVSGKLPNSARAVVNIKAICRKY